MVIAIVVNTEQKELIRQAAQKKAMTLSAYVRSIALQTAKKEVSDGCSAD